MIKSKFIVSGLITLFVSIVLTPLVAQQTDVSDAELKKFASVQKHIQTIDMNAQQEMVTAVQEGGLSVERFNEIVEAQNDPAKTADPSEKEMNKVESTMKEIETIQTDAQQKMVKKIQDEGLTVQRFREIAATIQNSPELQQKLQNL
jgi:hypothetical protein